MNVHDYQRFSEEVWQRNFHDVDIEHLREKSSIEREERDVNRKRGQAEKRYQGERWQRESAVKGRSCQEKRCQEKEASRRKICLARQSDVRRKSCQEKCFALDFQLPFSMEFEGCLAENVIFFKVAGALSVFPCFSNTLFASIKICRDGFEMVGISRIVDAKPGQVAEADAGRS